MLQAATLTFLRQLKKHNEKNWFDAHKTQYLAAKADFENFVQQLLTAMAKTNPGLADLQLKDCVFRIYKDVRFSKDKTPYKTHFAAGINKGGKKVHSPGYYLHIEPDGLTFCGGGIWRPAAAELKKIRQEIDYNLDEFLAILREKEFVKLFGPLEDEDSLIRMPQGYTEDNAAAYYLKMRNYITGTELADAQLTGKGLLKKVLHIFNTMKPFIDFLGRALE